MDAEVSIKVVLNEGLSSRAGRTTSTKETPCREDRIFIMFRHADLQSSFAQREWELNL